jgi:hypothetical protein
MPATTVRTHAKKRLSLQTVAQTFRELNRQAAHVVNEPASEGTLLTDASNEDLAVLIDELQETIRTLRKARSARLTSHRTHLSATRKFSAKTAAPVAAPSTYVFDAAKALVEKGQLVAPSDFQRLMGWKSRQALSKALSSNRVFYLLYEAKRYFPTFYADPAYERAHLEEVSIMLGDLPGTSKLQFFLTRKGSLNGLTPLQALAGGQLEKVKDIAAAFAELPA